MKTLTDITNALNEQIESHRPRDWSEEWNCRDAKNYLSAAIRDINSGKAKRAADYIVSCCNRLQLTLNVRPSAVDDVDVIAEAKTAAEQIIADGFAGLLKDLLEVDASTIKRSYSGRPGCACGCRGNYSEEPRTMKATRTKMINALRDRKATDAGNDGDGFFVETSTRLYFFKTR
jgi:hypothetical protein